MIIFIPGQIIYLLTFPGVILHEIAHRFVCDMLGVRVYHVCYFSLSKEASGYVMHENITSAFHVFLIAIAPLFINSIICMLLLFPFGFAKILDTTFIFEEFTINNIIHYLVIWAGFSIGYHAMPSNVDMQRAPELTKGYTSYFFLSLAKFIVALFNIPLLGPILRLMYAFTVASIPFFIFFIILLSMIKLGLINNLYFL